MKLRVAHCAFLIMLAVCLWIAPVQAQDSGPRPIDTLLPSKTLFYSAVDDYALMEKYAETMPISKIMKEEEVLGFFKKPKAYLDKKISEMKSMLAAENEALAAELDTLLDIELARFFFAITHVGLPSMGDPNGSPLPDLGLVLGFALKGDVKAEDLFKGALNALAESQDMKLEYKDASYSDVPYVMLSCPHAPEFPLYYFNLDNLFIVTLSQNSMKGMIDCYAGKGSGSIAKTDRHNKIKKLFTLDNAGSSESFVDLQGLINLLKEGITMALMMSGQEQEAAKVELVADRFALDSLDYVYDRILSKSGVARSESFYHIIGERRGLMALLPNKPLGKDVIKIVPKDVTSMMVFQFDLAALYDLILDTIKIVDEGIYNMANGSIMGVSAALSAGSEGPPMDIRKDILGQFGTRCIFYEGGGGMGMMMPSINFLIEIKDYDTYLTNLKKVINGMSNLDPELASKVELVTTAYKDTEIHYFQFADVPMVTPCFTKVGDYLAFGLQIDDLKKMIKRQGTQTESIADNEDFAKLYAMLPKDAHINMVSYSRTREAFTNAYSQIAMYMPMMTMALPPEVDLPIDFQMLPTADCIEQYLFSTMKADIQVNENLSKVVSYGPFGGECVQCLFPVCALAGFVAYDYYMAEMQKEYKSATGKLSVDLDDANALQSNELIEKQVRTDLAELSNRCFVYKIEFNAYPDKLEQLMKPTKDWPKGVLNADVLPKDAWGNAYYYATLQDEGKNYKIWSAGPNGLDENGEGDDLVMIR